MALPVVSGDQTTTLAWFAEMAYEDSWTTDQLGGWYAMSGSDLGISNALLSNGLYEYKNGSAMVTAANFNGSDVLCIAFRGSEDRADWVTNLTDIDEHFELFGALTSAATTALDAGTFDAILVTGHSLGGAMTEVMLHSYGQADIYGISWGSPGIHMDAAVADDRLINYVFADDGVAWLGTQRDDIADEIDLWSLGDAASLVDAFGVSTFSLVAALGDLDTDYHHQGGTILIDTAGNYAGDWNPGITLDNIEPYIDTHDMGRYLETSLRLGANPFSLPDSTLTPSTGFSSNETLVLKLYDTVYDTLPDQDTFIAYTDYLDNGGDPVVAAAAMIDDAGMRGLSHDAFLDEIFGNVIATDGNWWERTALGNGAISSAPANVAVRLASGGLEEWYLGPTLDVVGQADLYHTG